MKENYQLMTDAIIKEAGDTLPSLLLHACCAPCASYVLEYLTRHFSVTLYFHNPNIQPEAEYRTRLKELERLIAEMPFPNPVSILPCLYAPEEFTTLANGLEDEPEGGARCPKCYDLRLSATAKAAKEHGFDFFTTTLSVSPYKKADWLHEIGTRLESELGVRYLPADFKKRGGYLRSIELSKEYDLYRQNYCGCEYSKR